MQALQRQYCFQSVKILRKSKQSRKQQGLLKTKTKKKEIQSKVPLKAVLQFRRLKHKTSLKQSADIPSDRRHSQQIQHFDEFEQKIKKIKCVRRHTYYASDPNDEDKGEHTHNSVFPTAKTNARMVSQQTMYSQQFNKSRSLWKLKQKARNIQEHSEHKEKQDSHSKTFKKFKKLNETSLTLSTNMDENNFVKLIKKFRFQNLKQSLIEIALESPFSKTKSKGQQRKKEKSVNPFRIFQDASKYREQSTTKVPFHEKTPRKESRMESKLGLLTPWQTEEVQFLG